MSYLFQSLTREMCWALFAQLILQRFTMNPRLEAENEQSRSVKKQFEKWLQHDDANYQMHKWNK